MPEMILNLRLGPSRHKSMYHNLFQQMLDTPTPSGGWWRVSRTEYRGKPVNFQTCLAGWFRHRRMYARTRTDSEGNVYVQLEPKVSSAVEVSHG